MSEIYQKERKGETEGSQGTKGKFTKIDGVANRTTKAKNGDGKKERLS